jgi:hypothetical protein
VVEALVINPSYPQNETEIAALGEKCLVLPEAIQLDLRAN